MNANSLYLQSRLANSAALWTLGLAVTAWSLLAATSDGCLALLVKTIAPLGAAVVIGLGARSPFGDVEIASGNPLTRLRAIHYAGLVCCAAVLFLIAGAAEPDSAAMVMMVRNVAGFAGLALIVGAFWGVASAWIAPFSYGLITFLAAMPDHQAGAWAWPVRPADHVGSMIVAISLLVVGIVISSRRGAKLD